MGFTKLRFALNLSACQLLQSRLTETIVQLSNKLKIPAQQLVLEITETALTLQEKKATTTLQELHGLGFQISIDDFGTGYFSLSQLQQMPIRILKIDCEFTSNIGNNAGDSIVKTIISLAANFNLEVVAKGMETKEQEKLLLNNGCNLAQGFLYSKPISATEMTILLQKQNKADKS